MREGSAPLSPSSSVTSSASSSFPGASPNHRKRSAPHKASYSEGEETVPSSMEVSEAKRVKQQEMLGADLEEHQQMKKGQQRDSGIVVVVVDAENETSSTKNKNKDQELVTQSEATT